MCDLLDSFLVRDAKQGRLEDCLECLALLRRHGSRLCGARCAALVRTTLSSLLCRTAKRGPEPTSADLLMDAEALNKSAKQSLTRASLLLPPPRPRRPSQLTQHTLTDCCFRQLTYSGAMTLTWRRKNSRKSQPRASHGTTYESTRFGATVLGNSFSFPWLSSS